MGKEFVDCEEDELGKILVRIRFLFFRWRLEGLRVIEIFLFLGDRSVFEYVVSFCDVWCCLCIYVFVFMCVCVCYVCVCLFLCVMLCVYLCRV